MTYEFTSTFREQFISKVILYTKESFIGKKLRGVLIVLKMVLLVIWAGG